MNATRSPSRPRALGLALGAVLIFQASAALAQLSSPLGPATAKTGPPKTTTAPPAAAPAQNLSPAGVDPTGRSGPAVHSPLSAFAPLPVRADVVAWSLLSTVSTRNQNNRILPVFPLSVMALNQRRQKVQGFMLPLDPGESQTHFLLSQVPLTCSFCTPGGPESKIEVRTKTPIKYGFDVVVVEGKFNVLADDPQGLYYRVTEATAAR